MLEIGLENGRKLMVSGFKDPYYKMFMSAKWFRESCYSCPFAEKAKGCRFDSWRLLECRKAFIKFWKRKKDISCLG